MQSSSANLAIRVRDLSKAYRVYARPFDRLKEMILRRPCHEVVHALQPMSFDVRQGECVGVVGHNGAGKTTLLSLLTGTLTPTTGTIEVYGRVSSILGLGAGMIPTETGRENIRHGLITRGIDPGRWEELEREIIAFSELADAIDKPVQTYSSGMAMRLNFSIAHAVEPDILIVDEALSVGDARFVFKCQKKMREFLDKGKTLFFVSHAVGPVRQLCTTAILLHHGKIVSHGDVNDILDQYRQIYVGGAPQSGEGDAPSASTQAAGDARPVGGHPIELIDIQAGDALPYGERLWRIGQGDTLELNVRLRSSIRVERPSLGVVINSGYRNRMFGYATTLFGEPLPPIDPGEFSFTFRVPMYTNPGQYLCEINIVDATSDQTPRLLGRWEDAAKLIVEWRSFSINGIADVGAEIEYAGKVYSNEAEKRRRTGSSSNPATPALKSTRPMLVSVHLPKTGGQSFNQYLFTAYGRRVLNIDWATTPGSDGDITLIEQRLREMPDAEAMTSHALRFAYPPNLADRRMLYVTFLRDPWQQTMSYIRYICDKHETFPPAFRSMLPQRLEAMSPVEVAQRMMETAPEGFLSTFWFLPCAFFGLTRHAEPVIERLERFVLVGLSEKMDASVDLLRRRLEPFGMTLPPDRLPQVNRSNRDDADGQALESFAPLRDFLAEHAAGDYEVYNWARRQFERIGDDQLSGARIGAPGS